MNLKSKLFAAFTLLCVMFPAYALSATDPPRLYLALGDSLAVGVGATSPTTTGYVPQVFNFFKTLGVVDQLSNRGVSGETSGSFISGGQLANAVADINAATDTTVVTLDIGGNDVLNLLKPGQPCSNPQSPGCQPAIAAALGMFAQNYMVIMQQLTQALANDPGEERLIVATYYNPFSGATGLASMYDVPTAGALLGTDGTIDCAAIVAQDSRTGLNDLIACMGANSGARIIDLYPPFQGNAPTLTHISDPSPDIHPTDAGHAVIAQAIINSVNLIYLPMVMHP